MFNLSFSKKIPVESEDSAPPCENTLIASCVLARDGYDFGCDALTHRFYRAGSYFRQTFGLVDMPSEVDAGWAKPLLDAPATQTTVYVEPFDKARLARAVDQESTRNRYLRSRGGRRSDEVKWEKTIGKSDNLLRMLASTEDEFFSVVVLHSVLSDDPKSLTRAAKSRRETLKSAYSMVVKCISHNARASFMAASPLMVADKTSSRQLALPMPASTLGAGMWFTTTGIFDPKGTTLGTVRNGKDIVRVDFSKTTMTRSNKNLTILGESGQGKTTLMLKLCVNWLALGEQLIVLDPEAEFVGLAREAGGQVITLSGASKNYICPTQPRITSGEDSDVLADTIAFLRTFCQTAFGFGEDELSGLEPILYDVYEKFGIAREISPKEAMNCDYPLFSDIYAECESRRKRARGAEEERMAHYCNAFWTAAFGSGEGLWNHKTTVSRQSDFVVIDTHGIEARDKASKAATLLTVLQFTWDQAAQARRSHRPLKIIVDECHQVVNRNTPLAAAMVANMLKRCRKYDTSMCMITQQITDLCPGDKEARKDVDNDLETILNQSTFKILFGGGPTHLSSVIRMLDMKGGAKEEFKNCLVGECIVIAGKESSAVKIELSEWEKKIFERTKGVR